jgi:hypothetical protein
MLFLSLLTLLPLAAATGSSIGRNADNCYRAVANTNRLATASAFCATFTAASVPPEATSAIPTYLANCAGSVARVSSACACVFPPAQTISTCSPVTVTESATAYVTVASTVTETGSSTVSTLTVSATETVSRTETVSLTGTVTETETEMGTQTATQTVTQTVTETVNVAA